MAIEDKYISIMDAADYVGCSRQTIWNAVHDTKGKHRDFFNNEFKAGRAWVLRRSEVERFKIHYHSTEDVE